VEDGADCPSALAGLRAGDKIARIDGRSVFSLEDVASAIRIGEGLTVEMDVVRENTHVVRVQLRPRAWSGRGIVGFHLRLC
jgi:C-terminal processing protease CtpA/Prc